MVQHYDALVVGGGPASSTMARTLTQKGYRTLVVDKQSFPGTRPVPAGSRPPCSMCLISTRRITPATTSSCPYTAFASG